MRHGFFLVVVLLLASEGFASGLLTGGVRFAHSLSSGRTASRVAAAPDTVTVVAARISFPPERPTDNTFTTGLGEFDTTNAACATLDAAPHLAAYFQHHLEFLQNYVAAASAGRTVVKLVMLPNAAVVPKTMGDYAPTPGSATNPELVKFVDDAWRAADTANSTFDFAALDSTRTFYVIFHAGVGRDVDLSSTLGYNPQPQDLPSLYFNELALRNGGSSDYRGVPVHGGAVINNSAVIPETESRDVNGSHVILGLNGLLAASFGSYLGLPDLFNTANGYTAIGRFGLEDVASIFSFSGFIPPLPNAWERSTLGWVSPVELNSSSTVKHVVAAPQVAGARDTTVFRANINDREYFLLENRERNPDDRGVNIEVACDSIQTFHFASDATGFRNGDLSSLHGVVTSCSNYDWAAAASGILIWHIDENIVDQYRGANAVNASGHTKGVRLMEADGAQNIGVPVTTPFGTYISEGDDGLVDFNGNTWHRGNAGNFPRYSNEFSDTTQPDAHSNSNTNSGLKFFAFDTIKSRMEFDFTVQGPVHLVPGFPVPVGGIFYRGGSVVTADVTGDQQDEIFIATDSALLAYNSDGSKLIPNSDNTAIFASEPGIIGPSIDTATKKIFAVTYPGSSGAYSLVGWTATDANHDGRADTLFRRTLPSSSSVGVPMIFEKKIIVACDTMFVVYDESGSLLLSRSVRGSRSGAVGRIFSIAATDDAGVIIVDDGSPSHITAWDINSGVSLWSRDVSLSSRTIQAGDAAFDYSYSYLAVGDVLGDAQLEITVAGSDGHEVILDKKGNVLADRFLKSPTTGETELVCGIALTPAQSLVSTGFQPGQAAQLFATNPAGALLANFPVIVIPLIYKDFFGTFAPLIGDVNFSDPDFSTTSTRTNSAFAIGGNGLGIHAFSLSDGRESPGFPLAMEGSLFGLTLGRSGMLGAVHRMYAVTSSKTNGQPNAGKLYAYEGPGVPAASPGYWSQYLHDAAHTSLMPHIGGAVTSTEFFPKSRCFNWPNPVRDKFTHVRFYVSVDAVVHVKITNLANELVMELPAFNATGGLDNEIDLHTQNIQSGVYIVRVEAEGGGNSGVAFIKMAIVN